MLASSPTIIARRFDHVRETEGQNRGAWVSLFQRFTGNRPGDSWCASFVSFVLDVVYRGASPIKRSASCDDLLRQCQGLNCIVSDPQVDDLFFYVKEVQGPNKIKDAYHVGIVSAVDVGVNGTALTGIAGNTSPDGLSSNGTGVFEHLLAAGSKNVVFARLPR